MKIITYFSIMNYTALIEHPKKQVTVTDFSGNIVSLDL